MATKNDKFHIHPAYAHGHDWEEFIEALIEEGLEKHDHQFGWRQIVQPRTTLWRSKEDGPFDIISVELTTANSSIFGLEETQRRYLKVKCRECGRAMVQGKGAVYKTVPTDICTYCERDHQRSFARNRSRRYRQRHGLVKHLPIQQCAQCGWLFEPKRSTARFCSTTCRVKAHRIKGIITT